MANNFFDSNKQERNILGYEVSATQHIAPFVNGWYTRAYSNIYSMDSTRMSIRHYYGMSDKARWTVVYKYRTDTYYTVEVYDTVYVKGDFYNKTVFRGSASSLRDAVHMVNMHKSDK